MFAVREGRNWIGRDPGQADIVIEQDETLSLGEQHDLVPQQVRDRRQGQLWAGRM